MIPTAKTRTAKLILLAAIGIVAALVGALVAQNTLHLAPPRETLGSGTLLPSPRPIPNFALVDHTGALFDQSRLRGHWTFMFFGFTNCGDVCPTTLTVLAATAKTLTDLPLSQQPQVVFVSVDAKRDTPDILKAYVKTFALDFVGVTGTQTQLDAFTSALSVPSAIRPLENGSYAVDHYAGILAIDPQGNLRALFGAPHRVDALARDYRLLVGTP